MERVTSRMIIVALLVAVLASSFATQAVRCQVDSVMRGYVIDQTGVSGLYGLAAMAPNGRSFGVSTQISKLGEGGGYALVATDSVGGVFVTWSDVYSYEVYFICSHDYGRSWGQIIRFGGGGNPLIACTDPSVTVDRRNGYVYAEWIDNRTGGNDLYVCRSVDRGVSFGPSVIVNDADGSVVWSGASYSTAIAVGKDGTVYAAWKDGRTNPIYTDIYFARSTDHGQTFSTNIRVNPYEASTMYSGASLPWITVDEAGVVYVAYSMTNSTMSSVLLSRSLDGGLSFKAPAKVNDDSSSSYRGKKEVAVSNDGKVYMV